MTNHTRNNAWKQKHKIKRWVEYSRGYRSIALHNIVWGYKTRGRWGRELRIDGIKMRLLNNIQWVTKRYSRWTNVGLNAYMRHIGQMRCVWVGDKYVECG